MEPVVEVGSTRSQVWKTTEVRFHGFAGLPSEAGDEVESPEFSCWGNRWSVSLYPGGEAEARGSRKTSIYLNNKSNKKVEVMFKFALRNPNGEINKCSYDFSPQGGYDVFDPFGSFGYEKYINRSIVVGALTAEGAMVVDVRISSRKEPESPLFIPENPFFKNIITKLFMDEATADVKFEIGVGHDKDNRKRAKSSVILHAHQIVLKDNAPVLAELCKSGESGTVPITVTLDDIDPSVFRHLLYYVYGGKINGEDLKKEAKEIIEAADRYGVVGLKLEAEACYVESTSISSDNLMDNLLYADSKNCALLKEAVMDFVVDNGIEVIEKVSFDDCPGRLTKDLVVAMKRSDKTNKNQNDANAGDDLSTMRVSDLRRRLHQKGFDVDGSRETMVAMLREKL